MTATAGVCTEVFTSGLLPEGHDRITIESTGKHTCLCGVVAASKQLMTAHIQHVKDSAFQFAGPRDFGPRLERLEEDDGLTMFEIINDDRPLCEARWPRAWRRAS